MPRITDQMVMELVREYRTYGPTELKDLGDENGEPLLCEKIAHALLNNPSPFGALSHAVALLEEIARKALRYDAEAQADMLADAMHKEQWRKAA